MEEEGRISYHEYKRRLKKLTEEIKKEMKKSSNKNKKSESLLNLEEKLNKLNELYNKEDDKKGVEENYNNDDNNKDEAFYTNNLYQMNVISKKALRNRKKMEHREYEEEQIEKSRNKEGEKEYEELSLNLKKLNKTIYSIAPDGNCLYESIIHQLKYRIHTYEYTITDFLKLINKEQFSLNNINLKDYINTNFFNFNIFNNINPNDLSSDILRFITSIYLLQNKELFINFIYDSNDDEDKDFYFKYCEDIINGVYGSEIEIKALSSILKKKITVYDVNMNISYEEDCEEELFLCFHHKLYALGKHYNSVIDLAS
ncbi:conserved Plasmodium protein, unknown function [Plasmodium sp. gorilla clade G2]|uniref:conserved Plasmodium protein, unknown function n=1 Tax=Plasmodium sp. gorilla clade G2 TaxID=880535 RepID=UPI000D21A7AA|nr:conserved Plasmodium protein, unknown function [Plasmodium sp. gorilla clade G2]SOV16041.1 conserved Plasmodium protein, unknown function [Plasmodium sp. gorilla clade G2]